MSEKKVLTNIVNGEERPAASGDVLDIINPSTGEAYATSPNSGPEDVDGAFQAAAAAFESYRWTTQPSASASC
jgi:betaine-aldehyde dehydrogenase